MTARDLRELFEDSLSGEPVEIGTLDADIARGRHARRRRRTRQAFGATGAVGVLAAGALVMPISPLAAVGGDDEGDQTATQSDEGRDCASLDNVESPRALIDDPSWQVSGGDESSVDEAEIAMSDGDYEIEFWSRPVGQSWDEIIEDRTDDGRLPTEPAVALGCKATMIEQNESYFETLIPYGDYLLRVQAKMPKDEYLSILDDVQVVDRQTWLAAMPPDYRIAYDNQAAVAEVADELPVPDEFLEWYGDRLRYIDPDDQDALNEGVAHWAACHWVRESFEPDLVDDPSDEVRESLTAIQQWADDNSAITDEMVWEYAQAIIDGSGVVNGKPIDGLTAAGDLRCGGW